MLFAPFTWLRIWCAQPHQMYVSYTTVSTPVAAGPSVTTFSYNNFTQDPNKRIAKCSICGIAIKDALGWLHQMLSGAWKHKGRVDSLDTVKVNISTYTPPVVNSLFVHFPLTHSVLSVLYWVMGIGWFSAWRAAVSLLCSSLICYDFVRLGDLYLSMHRCASRGITCIELAQSSPPAILYPQADAADTHGVKP